MKSLRFAPLPLLFACGGLDAYNGGGPGTPEVASGAPTLHDVRLVEQDDAIEVQIEVTDAEADMVGGELELTVDGVTDWLVIPDDIPVWKPGSISRVYLSRAPCDAGVTHEVSARVIDVVGHASQERSDQLTLAGEARTLPETGDDESSIQPVGSLDAPYSVCSDLYRAGNDSQSYTGDLDWFSFRPASSGSWTMTLAWDADPSDYDLHLLDSDLRLIDQSVAEGTQQPERVTWTVTAGQEYVVVVGGWSGSAGAWSVSLR